MARRVWRNRPVTAAAAGPLPHTSPSTMIQPTGPGRRRRSRRRCRCPSWATWYRAPRSMPGISGRAGGSSVCWRALATSVREAKSIAVSTAVAARLAMLSSRLLVVALVGRGPVVTRVMPPSTRPREMRGATRADRGRRAQQGRRWSSVVARRLDQVVVGDAPPPARTGRCAWPAARSTGRRRPVRAGCAGSGGPARRRVGVDVDEGRLADRRRPRRGRRGWRSRRPGGRGGRPGSRTPPGGRGWSASVALTSASRAMPLAGALGGQPGLVLALEQLELDVLHDVALGHVGGHADHPQRGAVAGGDDPAPGLEPALLAVGAPQDADLVVVVDAGSGGVDEALHRRPPGPARAPGRGSRPPVLAEGPGLRARARASIPARPDDPPGDQVPVPRPQPAGGEGQVEPGHALASGGGRPASPRSAPPGTGRCRAGHLGPADREGGRPASKVARLHLAQPDLHRALGPPRWRGPVDERGAPGAATSGTSSSSVNVGCDPATSSAGDGVAGVRAGTIDRRAALWWRTRPSRSRPRWPPGRGPGGCRAPPGPAGARRGRPRPRGPAGPSRRAGRTPPPGSRAPRSRPARSGRAGSDIRARTPRARSPATSGSRSPLAKPSRSQRSWTSGVGARAASSSGVAADAGARRDAQGLGQSRRRRPGRRRRGPAQVVDRRGRSAGSRWWAATRARLPSGWTRWMVPHSEKDSTTSSSRRWVEASEPARRRSGGHLGGAGRRVGESGARPSLPPHVGSDRHDP